MALIIPRPQLQECSVKLQNALEKTGISMEHDPQAVRSLAIHVLNRVVPELGLMYTRPVQVEADMVLSTSKDEERLRRFNDVSFTGTLSQIRVVNLLYEESDEVLGELATESIDVMLGFTPAILDPDPADLIFSNSLSIPLSEIDTLVRVDS